MERLTPNYIENIDKSKSNVSFRVFACLLFSFLLTLALPGLAKTNQVDEIRVWMAPDHIRIVFDMFKPTDYRVFTLNKPDRVVVDLKDTNLKTKKLPILKADSPIKSIRYARRNKNDIRVVLDVEGLPSQMKHFKLTPNREYGHRVVVELFGEDEPNSQTIVIPKELTIPENVQQKANPLREVVVAIDAGHGGEDPGARGRRGTKEKEVVLDISRKLAKIIDNEPGMRAVLVRNGDYYISLRKRIAIARKHKADLFVSIHADAYNNPRVKGSSIYILSSKGASSEAARWLAAKENASDLMGGVSLDDKDDVLASVLLDLSLSGTIDVSSQVAQNVLTEIKKVGPIHSHRVQQAGFVVLKSPDIPSLLVETAFISNPREERRLRDPHYQKKLAGAIFAGVKKYFEQSAPPGTFLASNGRKHIIQSGETLTDIAQRYRISLARLVSFNGLSSDLVRAGQVIRIPSIN